MTDSGGSRRRKKVGDGWECLQKFDSYRPAYAYEVKSIREIDVWKERGGRERTE